MVSVRYKTLVKHVGGFCWGTEKKNKINAADGQLRETASSAALLECGGLLQHVDGRLPPF